jgi:hypothetical protein
MSERVYRIRGGGTDDNNDPIPGETKTPLRARAVQPGGYSPSTQVGRDGSQTSYSVFFLPAVDLVDTDRLEVRGEQFALHVEDWRSAYGTGRRGMVALCRLGKG